MRLVQPITSSYASVTANQALPNILPFTPGNRHFNFNLEAGRRSSTFVPSGAGIGGLTVGTDSRNRLGSSSSNGVKRPRVENQNEPARI